METPLYEYDQVITCPEIVNVIEQLVKLYDRTPKWCFIERMKTKAVIASMIGLHEALHLKASVLRQESNQ